MRRYLNKNKKSNKFLIGLFALINIGIVYLTFSPTLLDASFFISEEVYKFLSLINIILLFSISTIVLFNIIREDYYRFYILPITMFIASTIQLTLYLNFFDTNSVRLILDDFVILLIAGGILFDNKMFLDQKKVNKKIKIILYTFSSLIVTSVIISAIFFENLFIIKVLIHVISIIILIYVIRFIIQHDFKRVFASYLLSLVIIIEVLFMESMQINASENFYKLIKSFAFIYLFIGNFSMQTLKFSESVTKKEKQIQLYAQNIEKVIDKRTNEIKDMNKKLMNDLEYARIIQQSLLPEKNIKFDNVQFQSSFFPCERLSGDFYDIFRIDKNHIGLYLFDVSGHGVSAAMLTMFSKNYIKSDERLIRRYRGLKPHKNLKHFYEEFNETNFPDETHMVMFFATYNVETKILKYSSAGMNCYPILINKNGSYKLLDKSIGFPITKLGEFYTPTYTSENILLSEGDRIFFFTDGLIDEEKNDIFSEQELINFLINTRNEAIQEVDQSLNRKIRRGKKVLGDDITYIIMDID